MTRFARKITKREHRVSLMALLCHRETLDGIDCQSLARSYGLDVAEVEKAVADERGRRG